MEDPGRYIKKNRSIKRKYFHMFIISKTITIQIFGRDLISLFYASVIFPKIDTLLYWLGMSPFNRLEILSFFRRAVKRAVDQKMDDSKVGEN